MHDLMQQMIDPTFSLSELVSKDKDSHKVDMVLTNQNQKGYQQTIAFLESLLPLYNTLKVGGLPADGSWARVHVYARGLINSIQTERVTSVDLNTNGSLFWGVSRPRTWARSTRSKSSLSIQMCVLFSPPPLLNGKGKLLLKL